MPCILTRPAALLAFLLGTSAFSPTRLLPEGPAPFQLVDDAELVYNLLDAKGKKTGHITQRVVRLGSETNKKQTLTTTIALLKSGIYDAKSRLVRMQDLTYAAHRDTSFTDGMAELPPDALRRFRDRIYTYQPTRLAWPDNPTVGSKLPDGGVVVQVSSSAVDIAKVQAMLTHRRVVSGPQAVTTPAGTFQCYKVEAERDLTTRARADMAIRKVEREVTYYAPTVGVVRTEYYDRDKLREVKELAKR
ncbi:hypothetical protein H8B15_01875 [Hymenobacter sp. BT507]|uniref:DUF3108 domain-containing protein n=1 Tax=Hymenobacter citatus TaxID=2763506 RepID=A0ABR7MF19_9BACT|nr:hypothetical protein [Hymenobacter citatus]MBC6609651.1 hypothetical protein [Hymenobacter citatus]